MRGPQPNERQFLVVQPVARFGTEKGAVIGFARGVQWWEPGTPLCRKVVNGGTSGTTVSVEHPMARVIAVNVRDGDRFHSLFVCTSPDTVTATPKPLATRAVVADRGFADTPSRAVDLSKANTGQLSMAQQEQLQAVQHPLNIQGIFPEDPKRVTPAQKVNCAFR